MVTDTTAIARFRYLEWVIALYAAYTAVPSATGGT